MRSAPASPFAPSTRASASRSLVADDLQLDMPSVTRPHHAQQAAYGIRDPPIAPDDPAHVAFADLERQSHLVIGLDHFDQHRIGVVDQRASDILEEGLHSAAFGADAGLRERAGLRAEVSATAAVGAAAFSLISFATVADGRAPLPTHTARRSASIRTVAGSVSGS